MIKKRLFINGEWRKSDDQAMIPVSNPANGEIIGEVVAATLDDVNSAALAAHEAFKSWRNTSPFHRGALLRKSADEVRMRAEAISYCLSLEQGKPLKEALEEVDKAANILEYYAEEGERVYGKILPNSDGERCSQVFYEPIGPCAALSPWNYPLELLTWKLGAALAAGCTIVCKLPSDTPLSPLMYLEAVLTAGYPNGVINILTGSGEAIGEALVKHPLIRKIAFTGSTEVGRRIASYASAGPKPVTLELGGNSPMLVFADADLEAAVAGATRRAFRNLGQVCIAVNRIYVQRPVYDYFLEQFVAETKKLRIGHGAVDDCELGALCKQEVLDRTLEHIEDAVAKGALVLTGGKKPEGQKFKRGRFFEPTIVANASHDMLLMQEETFGPVVGVMPFDNLEEAISLANQTVYGLAAIVYSSSLATVSYAVRTLDYCSVAINNPDPGIINAPYGGRKSSGFGYEHAHEGLMEYLVIKHVRLKV